MQTSAVLRLGVHITLYTVNWESDITRAPLSFQINQTWTAFPHAALHCKTPVKDAQEQKQGAAASTLEELPVRYVTTRSG